MAPQSPLGIPQKRPTWAQTGLKFLGNLGGSLLLATIAASGLVLGGRAMGLMEGLELALYDQMTRTQRELPPDDRLLIVGIDETDIQRRQEWPIADETLAELLEIVLASDPRAVGLDIFRDIPFGKGQAALINQIQTDERVVSVCRLNSVAVPGVPPPPNIPETQVGFSDLVIDRGGTLRRTLLLAEPLKEASADATTPIHLCSDPEAQLFSLSLQLTLRYLAAEGIEPEITPDQTIKLKDTLLTRLPGNFGGYHSVESDGYQLLLGFRSARNAVNQVSLTEMLSGSVSPDLIRDRIVLIGATTPEAKDNFYTPYSVAQNDSQKMPGVIVHAQAVSYLLSTVLDGRPILWSWSTLGEGGWIVVWSIGGALLAGYIRQPIAFILGNSILLAGLYGLCYLLFVHGGWIPVVPAALGLVIASGGVLLLDRFNSSDYGKAVYQQVKSLLRLDIEIDAARLDEQVSEITETDYFTTLQQQARELRRQRHTSDRQHSLETPQDDPIEEDTFSSPAESSPKTEPNFGDFKQRQHPESPNPEDAQR